MEILITIKEKRVKVLLLDGKKQKDSLEIIEEHSLSEKLLPEIDSLLKRNEFGVQNIEKVRVESDQSDAFTTTRLAKSVANSWNEMKP